MTVRIVLFLVAVLLGAYGCKVTSNNENIYSISFCDNNPIERLRKDIGAESITGFLSTYTDSVEHVIVTVTILNPVGVTDFSRRDKRVADSIIKSIGSYDPFDSLIINYTYKTSFILFFTTKNTTYSYNRDYIDLMRSELFQKQLRLRITTDSLINAKDWNKVYAIIDSLSPIDGYKTDVFNLNISMMLSENPTDLTRPKEILLKEIAIKPLNRQLNYFLGYIYFQEKQFSKSAIYFDNMLRQAPNDPNANYHRGFIYVFAKDYKSAMKHFLLTKEHGSNIADKAIENLQKAGY